MTQDDSNTLSFEQAYARLETILDVMNSGKSSLDDSLKLYEEADQLIVCCNKKLVDAEKKIEVLIKNRDGELALSNGQVERQEFIPSSKGTV